MNERKAANMMKTSKFIRILSLALAMLTVFMTVGCGPAGGGKDETGDGTGTSSPSSVTTAGAPETSAPVGHTGQTPADVDVDYTVTVSPLNQQTNNGGIFQGWGTSLCWWANRLGYSDTLAQKAADAFYGDDGLRMNIMRYNIGGGDDPTHTHIRRTDSAVPGWLYPDGNGDVIIIH